MAPRSLSPPQTSLLGQLIRPTACSSHTSPRHSTHHMQKRIQSHALPQTWSSSCVSILLTGTAVHTANSQDRSTQAVLASPFPYPPPPRHIFPRNPTTCPTHVHLLPQHYGLFPLVTLPPPPRSSPLSTCNQSDVSISKHTLCSLLTTLRRCPPPSDWISSARHAS